MASDRRRTVATLAVLLGLGLAVRVPGLADPPVRFHPTRQYRSALIARSWLAAVRPDRSPVPADIAAAAGKAPLEPPVMEAVATTAYVIGGGERLWVPRLVATFCWLAAGLALYLLARRLAGETAGLVAAAVHLLLPYTVEAGRSFQPDPLLVALTTGCLLAVVRHDDEPGRRRLLVAAALGAAAAFVKPVALFFLVPVAVALAVRRRGARALWSREVVTFVGVAVLPAAAYTAVGLATGFLRDQAAGSFLPGLVLTGDYWAGWWGNLTAVLPVPVLAVAVVGVVVARGPARAVLAGGLAGYAAFGLVFGYHIHTHDYYSLPLVPLAALGCGTAASWVWSRASQPAVRRQVALASATLAVVAVVACLQVALAPGRSRTVAQAVEIRASVPAVEADVALTPAYGSMLAWHGGLDVAAWPYRIDLWKAGLHGEAPVPVEHRLQAFIDRGASRFVVTDLDELAAQPDLERLLHDRHRVISRGRDWVVFSLR